LDTVPREFPFRREPIVDVVAVLGAAFQIPPVRAIRDFFVGNHWIWGPAFGRPATFPFRTHVTLRRAPREEQTMYQKIRGITRKFAGTPSEDLSIPD
jgi:hypothetical protein